jgi:hypothetical protein
MRLLAGAAIRHFAETFFIGSPAAIPIWSPLVTKLL